MSLSSTPPSPKSRSSQRTARPSSAAGHRSAAAVLAADAITHEQFFDATAELAARFDKRSPTGDIRGDDGAPQILYDWFCHADGRVPDFRVWRLSRTIEDFFDPFSGHYLPPGRSGSRILSLNGSLRADPRWEDAVRAACENPGPESLEALSCCAAKPFGLDPRPKLWEYLLAHPDEPDAWDAVWFRIDADRLPDYLDLVAEELVPRVLALGADRIVAPNHAGRAKLPDTPKTRESPAAPESLEAPETRESLEAPETRESPQGRKSRENPLVRSQNDESGDSDDRAEGDEQWPLLVLWGLLRKLEIRFPGEGVAAIDCALRSIDQGLRFCALDVLLFQWHDRVIPEETLELVRRTREQAENVHLRRRCDHLLGSGSGSGSGSTYSTT